MINLSFPCFSGPAAEFLGTHDKRLNDLVRAGKIVPPPTVASGRRLWTADQVRQAAALLGALTPERKKLLGEAEGETTQ
jgi:hypothetical protein